MSVIQFPHGAEAVKRGKQPAVTPLDTPHNRLHLGPVAFTCPHCQTRALLTGENMIFRTLDFYCGGCGVLHRMVNPAFGQLPVKDKSSKF